jgi:integrase
VVDVLGDKPIDQYRSSDAAAYRDYSLERGLTVASVKRNFSTIRSIINLTISEQGIDSRNPFSKVFFPELDDVKDRKPIPIDTLRLIQRQSKQINDDRRWLLSLISDTGMRLAEAAGLAKEDICLDAEIPHLIIQPQPWRSLKTKGSSRLIPLVGQSLWAAKQVLNDGDNTTQFAFPRYTNHQSCNAGSASATLNKWLHKNFPGDHVIHSFRHSFRDRLRVIQCPSDVIDQLGGWSNKSVGEGYGEGYGLHILRRWLVKCSSH